MCDFDISILQVQLQHQQLLLESRVTRPAALQRVLGEGFLDSTCSWHRDSVNVSRPWLRVSWFPKNCTSDRFLSHGLKKWNSSIFKNSIYTKPLWFKPTRIQLRAVATCITAANNFFGDEAPAIQLSEHAQAVLADDAEHGFVRNDPVLRRMAAGSGHAVTWWDGDIRPCWINDLDAFKLTWYEARECFKALDDANLRANIPISYNKIGDDESSWGELSAKDFIIYSQLFFYMLQCALPLKAQRKEIKIPQDFRGWNLQIFYELSTDAAGWI